MSQTAIDHVLMDHESVPDGKRVKFQMLYESASNEALHAKRSNCDQAGGHIVRKKIAEMKDNGEEFFTIEELCKLRRYSNKREKKAFFWFVASLLMECICGVILWGRQMKHKYIVSKAIDPSTQCKVMTTSDEAFGLLIFENYIEKWKANKIKEAQRLEELPKHNQMSRRHNQARNKCKRRWGNTLHSGVANVSTVDGQMRAWLDSANSSGWCKQIGLTL
jgi:hypothetical protein